MKKEMVSGADRFARAQERIRAAFALSERVDPAIIVWPLHYIVFGTSPEKIPSDLFDSPARMLEFQTKTCQEHLAAVDDDFQPYLVPYYGTGVLASAFGCKMNFQAQRDPAVAAPCVETPADAAKLGLPDPERDGLMPRVLEAAAYMRDHDAYPVTLTDSQSPLDELVLMCGHERLYVWMYDEPGLVHGLFELVTEAFIQWVKAQKAVTGERLDVCYGEQGVWVPPGCGVWVADDEAVNISPWLYEEFVAPYYPRIFREFGGGVLHFCGDGSHLGHVLLKMEGLRAINAGPLGRPANLGKLQESVEGKIPLIYQEVAPLAPEEYFRELVGAISLRGVVFAPIVTDLVATGPSGYVEVNQERAKAAPGIYDALRRAVDEAVSRT